MEKEELKSQINKQFVVYPHPANDEPQPDLDPKDKLVYIAIRRYMNKSTMEAFPSYAKITEDIGASAVTIRKCVHHLIEQGYLETYKKNRHIIYKFNNKKFFEPYSFDFLDKKDLTFTEKAYIVATQQYMIKDEDEGKVSYTNKELSELQGEEPVILDRTQAYIGVLIDDIASVVSNRAKVPISDILSSNIDNIYDIEKKLKSIIIGHDKVIDSLINITKRGQRCFITLLK